MSLVIGRVHVSLVNWWSVVRQMSSVIRSLRLPDFRIARMCVCVCARVCVCACVCLRARVCVCTCAGVSERRPHTMLPMQDQLPHEEEEEPAKLAAVGDEEAKWLKVRCD